MNNPASFYSEMVTTYHIRGDEIKTNPHSEEAVLDLVVSLRNCLSAHRFYSSTEVVGDLYQLALKEDICLIRFELALSGEGYGVLFRSPLENARLPFRIYFAQMLINHMIFRRQYEVSSRNDESTRMLSQCVVDLFERDLLYNNKSNDDGWKTHGRQYFSSKVAFYISKGLPVQFCLPAFPCKSTNLDKVAATMPDGGEYEALKTLHMFCCNIGELYQPGAEICIVSDGHVFSDCTGTDDDVVSLYNAHLQEMYRNIEQTTSSRLTTSTIQFRSLQNLLFPDQSTREHFEWLMRNEGQDQDQLLAVTHPVRTCINEQDDQCRRILVNSCAPSVEQFQELVRSYPEHPLTALYRGFSRFMFDDLAFHQDLLGRSVSQRKKLAEAAAVEMIRRNQAYSRLIELVMPGHVRLSIHAHDNTGPKFGIKLLPQALASVDGLASFTCDESLDAEKYLHIPTPWHNALVEVHDGTGIRMACCKAEAIRVAGYRYDSDHPRGGRFVR